MEACAYTGPSTFLSPCASRAGQLKFRFLGYHPASSVGSSLRNEFYRRRVLVVTTCNNYPTKFLRLHWARPIEHWRRLPVRYKEASALSRITSRVFFSSNLTAHFANFCLSSIIAGRLRTPACTPLSPSTHSLKHHVSLCRRYLPLLPHPHRARLPCQCGYPVGRFYVREAFAYWSRMSLLRLYYPWLANLMTYRAPGSTSGSVRAERPTRTVTRSSLCLAQSMATASTATRLAPPALIYYTRTVA